MTTRNAETRVYYYGARYYDPKVSIWLSVDPLAMHPKQMDKSPYAFSWNNPVRYVDPDGRCPECEENVENPEVGETYESSGGRTYQYQNTYDEDGNKTGSQWTGLGGTLAEVEVDGGEMSDQARALRAGRELGIYASHDRFIDGAIGISGELTEKTGTAISWVGIGTLQPELVAAGQGISRVGTGVKIVGDLRNGNTGFAIERAAIEAVTGGLGTGIKSVSGSVLEKSILEGSLEAKKTIYYELISPKLSNDQ